LLWAQQDSIKIDANTVLMYNANDSIPVFNLDSITILPKMRFTNYHDLKRYRWIRRRVYHVYPFAKLSGENVEKLDQRLSRMNKRQRNRYMRIVKRWIKKEFEPKLKNLTQSEGRILSKLFYRQTGQTVYEFLKKYKSLHDKLVPKHGLTKHSQPIHRHRANHRILYMNPYQIYRRHRFWS